MIHQSRLRTTLLSWALWLCGFLVFTLSSIPALADESAAASASTPPIPQISQECAALMRSTESREDLLRQYDKYLEIARKHNEKVARGEAPYFVFPILKHNFGRHLFDYTFPRTEQYFTPEEAEAGLRLHVRDGLLWTSSGELFDTSRATNLNDFGELYVTGKALFVMRGDGALFAFNNREYSRFHHSSLLGGEPLAGAGEMRVIAGRIVGSEQSPLSDRTGHYEIPAYGLDQVFEELQSQGVSVDASGFVLERVGLRYAYPGNAGSTEAFELRREHYLAAGVPRELFALPNSPHIQEYARSLESTWSDEFFATVLRLIQNHDPRDPEWALLWNRNGSGLLARMQALHTVDPESPVLLTIAREIHSKVKALSHVASTFELEKVRLHSLYFDALYSGADIGAALTQLSTQNRFLKIRSDARGAALSVMANYLKNEDLSDPALAERLTHLVDFVTMSGAPPEESAALQREFLRLLSPPESAFGIETPTLKNARFFVHHNPNFERLGTDETRKSLRTLHRSGDQPQRAYLR